MTLGLAGIPVFDRRESGLLDHALGAIDRAERVMQTVLDGMGLAGRVLPALLPLADRVADRRLIAMKDPLRAEILAIREALGRPGPVAFNLSYEFGCTARVFDRGSAPMLFRTLDWPFDGLGGLVEIVKLRGPAGDWVTATWPGIVGCLHGAAPGRFAIALNQAPERQSGFGRAGDWVASKRRFLRATGMPPPHLLRLVFETAPDFEAACAMLSETPVAAPVIYTIAGMRPGEARTIERTENAAAIATHPAAANHFEAVSDGRWRPRGFDSLGRRSAVLAVDEPPALDALAAPILNPLTRLALTASGDGSLSVAGYDGDMRLTEVTSATV
ncbi:MAG: hypothetical protein ACFB03_20905 [Paracoccaceae bacterium]